MSDFCSFAFENFNEHLTVAIGKWQSQKGLPRFFPDSEFRARYSRGERGKSLHPNSEVYLIPKRKEALNVLHLHMLSWFELLPDCVFSLHLVLLPGFHMPPPPVGFTSMALCLFSFFHFFPHRIFSLSLFSNILTPSFDTLSPLFYLLLSLLVAASPLSSLTFIFHVTWWEWFCRT